MTNCAVESIENNRNANLVALDASEKFLSHLLKYYFDIYNFNFHVIMERMPLSAGPSTSLREPTISL
jgi:hypothetical protein